MPVLLDTGVAINIRDGDERAFQRFFEVADNAAVSLVTVVELTGGIYADMRHAAQRRAGLHMVLARLFVLPLEDETVQAYGDIVQSVGFSRRKVLDRLIAATAIVHGLTLVTTNGDDFADIPGLSLEVWPTQ